MFEFVAVPSIGTDEFERNVAHARTLGYPGVERAGHVAVVGGGHSLPDHLDELRAWKGPIWAINQTFMWLKSQGIKATFITADPRPQPWLKLDADDQALVCLHASAALFDGLRGAKVRTYEMGEGKVESGPTTATACPSLAFQMGHHAISFFGCDGSFKPNATHVFDCQQARDQIVVECGGTEFLTKPEFLMQADYLAMFCRELGNCHNRSGGLLAQMVETPARQVVRVADWMLNAEAA